MKINEEDIEIVEVVKGEVVEATGCTELVPSFSFKRMDFKEPSTILTYGEDVLSELESLVESVTNRLSTNDINVTKFKATVDKLASFSGNIELIEKERARELTTWESFLESFKTKILKHEPREERLSYKNEYDKYMAIINELREHITNMYSSSKEDFEAVEEFRKALVPFIKKLEEVHEFGKFDKERFALACNELAKEAAANPHDEQLKNESQGAQYFLNVIDGKIHRLYKAYLSINDTFAKYTLHQANELPILIENKDFLSVDSYVLAFDASAQVLQIIQGEKVGLMSYLNKGMNEAMVRGSETAVKNTKAVAELTKDGGITVETICTMRDNSKKAVDLYRKSESEKVTYRKSKLEVLDKIKEDTVKAIADLQAIAVLDARNALSDTLIESVESKKIMIKNSSN